MILGIDFGTSNTSAAWLRADRQITYVKEPLRHSYSFPTSVFLSDAGELVIGQAAENQERRDPSRFRREFKRDLGSDTPLLFGERTFQAEELVVAVLRGMLTEAQVAIDAAELTGAVLTVPATYGEHKRQLMERAGRAAGLANVWLLEEPVAAAIAYAETGGQIADGNVLLVYDLGGGTFDAALLRKTADGYEPLVSPVGLDHCGGVDFDRAIYHDLLSQHPEIAPLIAPDSGRVGLQARAMVGEFCRNVKHQLSAMTEAVDILMLGSGIEYRLTREQFEQMIAPHLTEANDLCAQLISDAGLKPSDIAGILLVGGSCRIPAVAASVERVLERPVWRVRDPELAVVEGAAIWGPEAAARHQDEETKRWNEIDTLLAAGDQIGAIVAYQRQRTVPTDDALHAIRERITASISNQKTNRPARSGKKSTAQSMRSVRPRTPLSESEATALNAEIERMLWVGRELDAVNRYLEYYAVDAVEALAAIADWPLGELARRRPPIALSEVTDETLIPQFESHLVASPATAVQIYLQLFDAPTRQVPLVLAAWSETLAERYHANFAPHATLTGHTGVVNAIAFSPDGQLLASASADNSIRLWDVTPGSKQRTLLGHNSPVNAVAFSPDGLLLASGGNDLAVRIWDVKSGKEQHALTGHTLRVTAIAFSPDSEIAMVASGSDDKTIRLWQPMTGATIRSLLGHGQPVRTLAFTPDGRTLTSGSLGKRVRVWDPQSGVLQKTISHPNNGVLGLAITANGQTMYSVGSFSSPMWSALTGTVVDFKLGTSLPAGFAIALSPDDRLLAMSSIGNQIRLWDLKTGIVVKSLDDLAADTRSIAFSPDGTLLAAADGTNIRLWRLAEPPPE